MLIVNKDQSYQLDKVFFCIQLVKGIYKIKITNFVKFIIKRGIKEDLVSEQGQGQQVEVTDLNDQETY